MLALLLLVAIAGNVPDHAMWGTDIVSFKAAKGPLAFGTPDRINEGVCHKENIQSYFEQAFGLYEPALASIDDNFGLYRIVIEIGTPLSFQAIEAMEAKYGKHSVVDADILFWEIKTAADQSILITYSKSSTGRYEIEFLNQGWAAIIRERETRCIREMTP